VVLVDNGRSAMLGSEYREMLRCIRCGACPGAAGWTARRDLPAPAGYTFQAAWRRQQADHGR